MFNIVTRLAENRALDPPMPVFCSESYYERADDPETAYHARWQVWTAFLNGAAGYGYGAQGVWQFLDLADPDGETGKRTPESIPWRDAAQLPGSKQVGHARSLLTSLDWWKLEPRREALELDGQPNPLPTASNLTPPQAAALGQDCWIVYLPRGNVARQVRLATLAPGTLPARWFDPRQGVFVGGNVEIHSGRLPARPEPRDEDWVLVMP
jgi:hypothetical protein